MDCDSLGRVAGCGNRAGQYAVPGRAQQCDVVRATVHSPKIGRKRGFANTVKIAERAAAAAAGASEHLEH